MPLAGRVHAKIARRILPYFFLLYIVAYLDRANVAFAKLSMAPDLGFSEAVYGAGAGIFFLGYFLLEIPGALIVERWSARLWISRILITWGICTVLVSFVKTANGFYLTRFLLGLAEAGFFPGVIIYFTHWFPMQDRARAIAGLTVAVPVSFVIGAPLSAWCLSLHWFGLQGWRWLFIVQGLPAIILGLITPFCLTDHPHQASWLAPDERAWLTERLERERQQARAAGRVRVWDGLTRPHVFILAAALCLIVIASYGFIFWLPATIHRASGYSVRNATLLSALPFLAAIPGVWFMGKSSDRRGERKLHTALPLLLGSMCFALTAFTAQPFWLTMIWLSLTGLTLWAWGPSYWALPTMFLGESAAAVSVGFINSIGNLGGFIGPYVVGLLRAQGVAESTVIWLLSAAMALGAVLILLLRIPPQERGILS